MLGLVILTQRPDPRRTAPRHPVSRNCDMATDEPYVAVIDGLKDLVDPVHLSRDVVAIHARASALTGRLKSLARAANSATRATKNLTAAARLDMDQSHLGLQNLLYEKRHLEREIEKCRQFA